MIKKYGVRNTSEGVFKFRYGKANIVCKFTNGNLQSREPIPASYSTNNKLIQHVIETSEQFRNNRIYIIATYEEESDRVAVVEAPAEPAPRKGRARKSVKIVEDVTDLGGAVTYLMDNGADSSEITDLASALKVAESMGVSFPNLNAE